MKVLIETRMNSLKLNESKTPKKGCLGRLEGVCADFKNPTRNGRLYPLELWKKVFEDNLFQESLKSKTLFGELDHPEDRFEPLMSKACIVMTDYTIDEDAGLIYGGFDILDTPDGRTLKSILDYGSVLGVSSRGQGDIIESADGERVDEDTYEFACFDVVSTPAVEKARQNVVESVKRKYKDKSFKESITHQIDDAESVTDLNIIRSVVRSSNLNGSDMDLIIESIENKCKALQTKPEDTILESEETLPTTTLEETSANTIRDKKQLYNCIKSLRSTVSAYKHRESRFVETIGKKDEQIERLRCQLERSKKVSSNIKEKLDTKTKHFESKQNNSTKQIFDYKNRLFEAVEQKEELEQKLVNDKQSFKQQLLAKDEQIEKLTEKVERYSNRVNYLESVSKNMEKQHSEEIASVDDEVIEYTKLLHESERKVQDFKTKVENLTESLNRSCQETRVQKQNNAKLLEQLQDFRNCYLQKSAKMAGISPDMVKSQSIDNSSPKQLDKLVESVRDRLDRYNDVPISNKGINDTASIVVESLNRGNNTEEDGLMNFLSNTLQAF